MDEIPEEDDDVEVDKGDVEEGVQVLVAVIGLQLRLVSWEDSSQFRLMIVSLLLLLLGDMLRPPAPPPLIIEL